jgi:CPA2 family monovalent cation:H+ antiporter-2
MFSIGLEFNIQKIYHIGPRALVIAAVEVFLMIGVGYVLGLAIGWSSQSSLFLGVALSISSTTIIVKTLEELHLKQEALAQLIFGVLIVEDLLAIILLALLPTMANAAVFSFLSLLMDVAKLLLIISSWFALGYFLVPAFFRLIRHSVTPETLILLAIGFCLFLVCLSSYFNYSEALGAFMMGSIIASVPQVHRIERLLMPIRDIFSAIFFVSVGMLVQPQIIFQHFPLILLISAVTIGGKILTSSLGGLLAGQRLKSSLRLGFAMAQIGEFSFIIVGMGVVLGVINQELSAIIVAISVITTFLTPYLIRFSIR